MMCRVAFTVGLEKVTLSVIINHFSFLNPDFEVLIYSHGNLKGLTVLPSLK